MLNWIRQAFRADAQDSTRRTPTAPAASREDSITTPPEVRAPTQIRTPPRSASPRASGPEPKTFVSTLPDAPTADDFIAHLASFDAAIEAAERGDYPDAYDTDAEAMERAAWDAGVAALTAHPHAKSLIGPSTARLLSGRQFLYRRPEPAQRMQALHALSTAVDQHLDDASTLALLLGAIQRTVETPGDFLDDASHRTAVDAAARADAAHHDTAALTLALYKILAESTQRQPPKDVHQQIVAQLDAPFADAAMESPDEHKLLILRHRILHEMARRDPAQLPAEGTASRLLDEIGRLDGRGWRRGEMDAYAGPWAVGELLGDNRHRAAFLAAGGVERLEDLTDRIRRVEVPGTRVLRDLGWTPEARPTSAHLAVRYASTSLTAVAAITYARPQAFVEGLDAHGRTALDLAIDTRAGDAVAYMAAAGLRIPVAQDRDDLAQWVARGKAARTAATEVIANASGLDMDTSSVVLAHAGVSAELLDDLL